MERRCDVCLCARACVWGTPDDAVCSTSVFKELLMESNQPMVQKHRKLRPALQLFRLGPHA